MKKILSVLIFIAVLFVPNVFAELYCEYNLESNKDGYTRYYFKINDSGNIKEGTLVNDSKDTTNNEGLSNWGTGFDGALPPKKYYESLSTKACPDKVVFFDSGAMVGGYEISAYYSKDTNSGYTDMINYYYNYNNVHLNDGSAFISNGNLTSYAVDGKVVNVEKSEEDIVRERITEYNAYLSKYILGSDTQNVSKYCTLKDGVYIADKVAAGYDAACRDAKTAVYTTIESMEKYVSDQVKAGKIKERDTLVSNFKEFYVAVSKTLGETGGFLGNRVDIGEQAQKNVETDYSNNDGPTEKEYNWDDAYVGDYFCEEEHVLKGFKIVGLILLLARIIVPLIIIVMGSLDLFTVVVNADPSKDMPKEIKKLAFRVCIGVAIFFIFPIISWFVETTGLLPAEYRECEACVSHPTKYCK